MLGFRIPRPQEPVHSRLDRPTTSCRRDIQYSTHSILRAYLLLLLLLLTLADKKPA